MNAELGRKVLDHVTAHREQFDMHIYAGRNECGTTACLAGWAMLLSPGYKVNEDGNFTRPDGSAVDAEGTEARKLLDFEDEYFSDYARHGEGLFVTYDEDEAIRRFRALVEAAEAAAAS